MPSVPAVVDDTLRRRIRTDLPLVALSPAPPGWLAELCRATGRSLETRAQEWPPDAGPLFPAAHLVRTVNQLAGRTVWVARGDHPARPTRVVAAIRDLPGDADVLAEAAAVTAHLGATLVIAHAVPRSFAERSVALDDAIEHGRDQLAIAARATADRLPQAVPVVSRLVRIRPYELVGEALDADLLVIGGPRADGGDSAGLVLSSALQHAPCPVLLAPRRPTG
jgi:nucleotide-binding universal stress UspA family protein